MVGTGRLISFELTVPGARQLAGRRRHVDRGAPDAPPPRDPDARSSGASCSATRSTGANRSRSSSPRRARSTGGSGTASPPASMSTSLDRRDAAFLHPVDDPGRVRFVDEAEARVLLPAIFDRARGRPERRGRARRGVVARPVLLSRPRREGDDVLRGARVECRRARRLRRVPRRGQVGLRGAQRPARRRPRDADARGPASRCGASCATSTSSRRSGPRTCRSTTRSGGCSASRVACGWSGSTDWLWLRILDVPAALERARTQRRAVSCSRSSTPSGRAAGRRAATSSTAAPTARACAAPTKAADLTLGVAGPRRRLPRRCALLDARARRLGRGAPTPGALARADSCSRRSRSPFALHLVLSRVQLQPEPAPFTMPNGPVGQR